MDVFAALASPRKPSVMEGRIEDTFYKDLKREWRSGSIAVMTESFKNLPFVVSILHLLICMKNRFFFRWGTKWNWPSTPSCFGKSEIPSEVLHFEVLS